MAPPREILNVDPRRLAPDAADVPGWTRYEEMTSFALTPQGATYLTRFEARYYRRPVNLSLQLEAYVTEFEAERTYFLLAQNARAGAVDIPLPPSLGDEAHAVRRGIAGQAVDEVGAVRIRNVVMSFDLTPKFGEQDTDDEVVQWAEILSRRALAETPGGVAVDPRAFQPDAPRVSELALMPVTVGPTWQVFGNLLVNIYWDAPRRAQASVRLTSTNRSMEHWVDVYADQSKVPRFTTGRSGEAPVPGLGEWAIASPAHPAAQTGAAQNEGCEVYFSRGNVYQRILLNAPGGTPDDLCTEAIALARAAERLIPNLPSPGSM